MYPALQQSHRRITLRLRSPDAEFLGHHPNKGVPEDVFQIIVERFPVYLASKSRIELMLPFGHPDLKAFVDFARTLSLNIEPNRATQSQVEILDYTKYSKSEVQTTDFLEGMLTAPLFDGCIDIRDGRPVAIVKQLKSTIGKAFGSLTNFPNLIFIRGREKSRLESHGLNGLILQPVGTDRPDANWPDDVEPLYLVWSSIEFPCADMEVFDAKGSILKSSDWDWANRETMLYPLDGYEVQPMLHYQKWLPAADVGLSKEHFGGHGYGYRRIVFSQRGRMALEEMGMQLDWVPVRTGQLARASPPV
jgi:hypothetical protein